MMYKTTPYRPTINQNNELTPAELMSLAQLTNELINFCTFNCD